MNHSPRSGDSALLWIGGFKLGKGLLLLALATGLLSFMHKDVAAVFEQWLEALHFDPENRHIAAVLDKLGLLDDRKIKELSGLTFVYATMFLTEGIGLLMKKRWAEYLTVIATASLVPIEVFEVCKHFGPIKLGLLIFNVGIVWFLIRLLKQQHKGGEGSEAGVLEAAET